MDNWNCTYFLCILLTIKYKWNMNETNHYKNKSYCLSSKSSLPLNREMPELCRCTTWICSSFSHPIIEWCFTQMQYMDCPRAVHIVFPLIQPYANNKTTIRKMMNTHNKWEKYKLYKRLKWCFNAFGFEIFRYVILNLPKISGILCGGVVRVAKFG